MKHCVVLIIAALTLAAEGSVIPWYWPGPLMVPAPAGLALPGATVIQSNPAPTVVLPAPVAAVAVDASGVPTVVVAPAPLPPAVVLAAPAPTSVSATRGAVHVAPLPGHSVSQQQLNLAPAPGSE